MTRTQRKNGTKRHLRKLSPSEVVDGGSDKRPTKDNADRKRRRKLEFEETSRPLSAAVEDGDKGKFASSIAKREKEDRRCRHKKNVDGEQGATKTPRQNDADGLRSLPIFNLGEYPSRRAAVTSRRLDAIRKGVERAHKSKRQSEKQKTLNRRGVDDDQLGTRKTLERNALLEGKTEFIRLKVDPHVTRGVDFGTRAPRRVVTVAVRHRLLPHALCHCCYVHAILLSTACIRSHCVLLSF